MLSETQHIYFFKNFDIQISSKITELQVLTTNFLQPNQKLANFEKDMEAIHESIRDIEAEKDSLLKNFTLLKDHISPQITLLENYIDECTIAKGSYDKFSTLDLNTSQVAAYALCALISVLEVVKDSWKKHLAQWKVDFVDCFSKF